MVVFRIRGRLGSISLFLRNVGTLMAYIFGATLDYIHVPYVCVVVPIAFVIIFMMMPNTPRYFVNKGEMKVIKIQIRENKSFDDKFYQIFRRLKIPLNFTKAIRERIQLKMTHFIENMKSLKC